MEGTSSQCRVKFSEHWGESPQFPAPTEMGDDNAQGTGGLREQREPMTSDEKLLSITSSHREEKKLLQEYRPKCVACTRLLLFLWSTGLCGHSDHAPLGTKEINSKLKEPRHQKKKKSP